ncbi:PLP-dependent aminotransferase family protein [Kolteria novifilia]|uniref:aminotransferase-like domain-containing protein n=1 Tax=Kolteria novifilia TaxID=2527975 RepID=UPI003AF38C58
MHQPTSRPAVSFSDRVRRSEKPPISYLMEQGLANPNVISLAAGFVDNASLPVDEVRQAATTILADRDTALAALQYGTTDGYPELRRQIVEQIARLDERTPSDLGLDPQRVIVGTGSQQLLYLVGEVLLDPGDIVLLGVPGYFVYMGALESFGARIVPIRTDEEGLDPEAVEAALEAIDAEGNLERVKFIYDVSYFNNPTGLTLSEPRKRALVEIAQRWSKRHRIVVVEDAAYRELRYRGSDLPSMLRFDPDGQTVLYAGTFSKPFSPGMKTGYVIVPTEFREPLINQKGHEDFGTSNLNQHLLAELMRSGAYQSHLKTLRDVYREKMRVTIETLEAELRPVRERVSWTSPEGGLYVWLTLPEEILTSRGSPFFEDCLKEGMLYVPAEFFYPRSATDVPHHCLRLSFGVPPLDRVREGVRRLARVVLRHLG